MSKGGGGTTTVQNNDPWKPAQPYIKGGLSDLSKWYASDYGRQQFPGSTVVPFNPMTEQALGMTASRAMSGSPLIQAAQQQNLATQRGDFLSPDSNPWLSGAFDLAAGKVRSSLDSQFNKGGGAAGYGSSAHQGAMAENMGDLATKMYGGHYGEERNRQTQASMFAPQLAQQDYFDFGQLAGVGNAFEQQAGNYVKEALGRWDWNQQEPFNRVKNYFGVLNPTAQPYAQQTQKESGGGSNPLSTILGIASTAAGLPIWSDRDAKENIVPIDDSAILEKCAAVPGYAYNYKAIPGDRVGPMADDFASQYGGDGKAIPMPQLLGELWTAVSALTRKVRELEERLS